MCVCASMMHVGLRYAMELNCFINYSFFADNIIHCAPAETVVLCQLDAFRQHTQKNTRIDVPIFMNLPE